MKTPENTAARSTGPTAGAGVAGNANGNQGEIARRALKALAERKLVPTPDTFAEVYFEIAGARPGTASASGVIKELLRDLVKSGRVAAQEATALMEQVARHDWPAVRDAVDKLLARRTGASGGGWPQAALLLLKQADALHNGWTRARKLEAVTRVIESNTEQPDLALERLQRLMESWGPALASLPRPEEVVPAPAPATPPPTEVAMPAAQRYGIDPEQQAQLAAARAEAEAWKQVALRSLKLHDGLCGDGTPAQHKLREYIVTHAQPVAPADVDKIVPRFIDVVAALETQLGEQQKIKQGLQRLLALLCDNMKSLTPEEAWLAGQLEPIRALLAGPIQSQQLAEAEARLSQVIGQQAGARKSLQEAKVALKEMLATLIERIGTMGASTGRFYDQVGGYQQQLEKANDFETLSRVIKGLLADTSAMRTDIQASRDELLAARRKVETYEQRVRQLEQELTQVSALVQKDPLTHAMNRRGLEEAFRVETARAARYGTELSLAMLDVDNFKPLNDTLGHLAGDRALVHLLSVLQAVMRPTDIVSRVGGEEFAVLFSTTDLAEAVTATQRAQAELAKRPFLHEGRNVHLTFSAGAAQWKPGEALESIMQRADQALYAAKRSGKNKVIRAD